MDTSKLAFILSITILVPIIYGKDKHISGRTCSKEDGCPGESSKQDLTLSKNLPVHVRDALHTIVPVEMYRAQKEVAHYLEFAYLSLFDHPVQAKQVRLTAVKAKHQHMLSSDLMNRFKNTAIHIIETLIPMIIDGHLILNDTQLVEEALDQIIDEANEMKEEAEKTRNSYMEIERKVNENMGDVDIRNKFVRDDKKRIRVEMDNEIDQVKTANIAQEELKQEKEELEEELEGLKSNRDMLIEQAGMAGQNMARSSDSSFSDFLKAASPAMSGNVVGIVLGVVGVFSELLGSDKRMEQYKMSMDAYIEAQRAVERAHSDKRKILRNIHDQRKQALERLGKLKTLGLESANYGDEESLELALEQLGEVQVQLTRIIQHWAHVATALKSLRSTSKPQKLFLKKIDDPKYSERFLAVIDKTKTSWSMFRDICESYARKSDTEIYNLYKFLSAPISNMASENRSKRQQDILRQIEIDIETTYPKLE